jgi:hypothetical protein
MQKVELFLITNFIENAPYYRGLLNIFCFNPRIEKNEINFIC